MFSEAETEGLIDAGRAENLIFCTNEVLKHTAEDDFLPEKPRAAALAELMIREYFSCDPELREWLDRILRNGETAAFLRCMPHQFFHPGEEDRLTLWQGKNSLSVSCCAALRNRLKLLLLTDGVIPVERGETGWMIPFDLQESAGPAAVRDLSGTTVPEWTAAIAAMHLPYSVRLHCFACPELGEFTGHSLMLPVLVAQLRKQNVLPCGNPFRMIFTGAMDETGRLMPVSAQGKAAALVHGFPSAHFFLPESDCGNTAIRNVTFLPCIGQKELVSRLQEEAEKLEWTLLNYALKRLPSLDDEVRSLRHCNWDGLISRLEHTAAFDEDENPGEYLLHLMLQSEANCHAGHTSRAMELNRQALHFAERQGKRFEKLLLHLQIDKMVQLLDCEAFSEIGDMAPGLGERVRNFGDTDLEMRFCGTMGQIYAYGTLAGVAGCSAEASLQAFETAKDRAFELGILREKRQDVNYLHLWQAIFHPGTPEEKAALRRAETMAAPHEGEDETSPTRLRNLFFLRRQQFFGRYRNYLLHGVIDLSEIPADLNRLLEGEPTWCRALVYKYLGALAAAGGDRIYAEECFSHAIAPMQGAGDPIIDFIRLTIAAEGWHSLGDDTFRLHGLELARKLQDSHSSPGVIEPWLSYLEGNTAAPPFVRCWY